jgi:serine/threonine protein phosphatase PrpC
VIALPEVITHRRSPNDEYLVLACDGVWDVMENDDVAAFVARHVAAHRRRGGGKEVGGEGGGEMAAHCRCENDYFRPDEGR